LPWPMSGPRLDLPSQRAALGGRGLARGDSAVRDPIRNGEERSTVAGAHTVNAGRCKHAVREDRRWHRRMSDDPRNVGIATKVNRRVRCVAYSPREIIIGHRHGYRACAASDRA
jgi:hypothetical protein